MTMYPALGPMPWRFVRPLSFDGVHGFLDALFGDDLRAERVKSLAGATLGAIESRRWRSA